jgi:hypothetical protein
MTTSSWCLVGIDREELFLGLRSFYPGNFAADTHRGLPMQPCFLWGSATRVNKTPLHSHLFIVLSVFSDDYRSFERTLRQLRANKSIDHNRTYKCSLCIFL